MLAARLSYALKLSDEERAAVLEWSLLHDLSETLSGDVAGPARRMFLKDRVARGIYKKWEQEEMSARFPWWDEELFSDKVKAIVAFCDALEATCFLEEEQTMGNKIQKDLMDRMEGLITAMANDCSTHGLSFSVCMSFSENTLNDIAGRVDRIPVNT